MGVAGLRRDRRRSYETSAILKRLLREHMERVMKLLGHSAHQVLVVFPVGLLITSVIFEMLALATGSAQFWVVSYWLIASGLVGGLAAAVFGLLDYVRIPRRTRANRVGMLHGIGNAAVIVLFAASWWMRAAPDQTRPRTPSFCLSPARRFCW
jgi:uncharacterized membrane protein